MGRILYLFLSYLYEPLCFMRAKRYLNCKKSWEGINKSELSEILTYAQVHSPYYRSLLKDMVINPKNAITVLKTLPILTKDIIRGGSVFSEDIGLDWKIWKNTGGSTGEPLSFPSKSSVRKRRWEHINQMMLFIKMGYKPFDMIASFDGIVLSDDSIAKGRFYELRDKNFPYGIYRYPVLNLTKETVSEFVNSLNRQKPKFIRSYPSGLLTFCKLLIEKELRLNFKLKGCYLTSENFSKQDKEFISSTLNCPVWGQYGHTESSVFAIQEPTKQEYMCSPLYGYTEVLNEQGEHVSVGEMGTLIVTGFNEYGMPFIRYNTGDLAIYGGRNDSAEVILNKLLGRDSDYIFNNNNEKIYLVGFIFGAHLLAFNDIDAWQIIQERKGEILMKIVRGVEYTEQSEQELMEYFYNNNITLSIKYVSEIEKTKRGKQKFLIQNIYE